MKYYQPVKDTGSTVTKEEKHVRKIVNKMIKTLPKSEIENNVQIV